MKFKNIESGRHGYEGISRGGELYGNKKNKGDVQEYYGKINEVSDQLLNAAREYYIKKDTIDSAELSVMIVQYNMLLARYRYIKKEYYKSSLRLDYNINSDISYIEYNKVVNDMKNDMQKKQNSESTIKR